MIEKKVWFITGAGRGMGVHIAKAALSAGHAVVATGRNIESVTNAVGTSDDLLVVKLDITNPEDAATAVKAAVDRFGHIDILVNNAGNFYAGFFEEITPKDFRAQIETLLFGPINVTRALLPVMRKQRSGLVVTISSLAGIVGQEFVSAYSAAKFGIEGWMESISFEVAPFGIRTMIVEPGFFRTDLLTNQSTKYPEPSIEDYAELTKQTVSVWKSMNGKQTNDPAKLANALVTLAAEPQPPRRFIAGADAIAKIEGKVKELTEQINAYRELSSSMAHNDIK
jgi:NAD(P)-dependent dehydrogenase (short-subunit alcohol dehydrogenase family)